MIGRCLLSAALLLLSSQATGSLRAEPPAMPHKTENILFVMLDGFRWQELFTGAEEELIDKARGGVENVEETKKLFWRDTPEARREVLLPFIWEVIAKEGQIYGNAKKSSVARVTNLLNFSYPGYSEVLCGYPDMWVSSNDKIYNRNVTMLEWLHQKPEFTGKIAAFTSWDVFPYIINAPRSGILVNSGFSKVGEIPTTSSVTQLNNLISQASGGGNLTRFDALTFQAGLEYLKAKKPRILYLSFDETDAHGHGGHYDRLLASAHKEDGYLRQLWETVQGMPEYRGKTTLVITTDHGRGNAPVEWKSHAANILPSQYTWIAFLGPDTPALGERQKVPMIGQNQIAATVASLLGYDYNAAQPKAGKPIADVLPSGDKK